MKLEGGYEKIRIAKKGVNQDKVNRLLRWIEGEGFIVWNSEADDRYEVDGISKETQKEIQAYLERLGRTFRKGPPRIVCLTHKCFNEADFGSIYCKVCNDRSAQQAAQRKIARARANPCWHRGCDEQARGSSGFCFFHRNDTSW